MSILAGKPILVVDDNRMNLKLTRVLLEAEGCRVVTAMDAPDALLALQSFNPCLILSDLQLPGEDGIELAQRLKLDPRYAPIPVIIATSYAQAGDAERARAAGCAAYIHKPIDTQELPAILAGFLEGDGGPTGAGETKKPF